MKKIFLIALIGMFIATVADAQKTRPRFGILPNENNTFSGMSFGNNFVKDVSGGTDTVGLYPNNYVLFINPGQIADTITYAMKTTANCYKGDQIEFICTNATGASHQVRFTNLYKTATVKPFVFAVAAADSIITLNTGKGLFMRWFFDGSQWIETNKVVE